jgi:molybdopterin molybdotransferase
VIAFDEALARLVAATPPLPPVSLKVVDALGCRLAADVLAMTDLPPFDQSALDGYALRLADGSTLPVEGNIAAGRQAVPPQLKPNTACRIFTGGVLPQGADVVVAQEHTERSGEQLQVLRLPALGGGVRRLGEELCKGALIAQKGSVVTPALAAAMAMAGVAEVLVTPKPTVVVLVTGDEIVPAGQTLQLGQVYDANSVLLATWLAAEGCTLLRLERLPDDAAQTRSALQRAAAEADVVLSSGGVSVGDHDHIPSQCQALGAEVLFWKVAQKPGKPVFAARLGKALVMGLPGNPAAVLINLAVLARPALARLAGAQDTGLPWQQGVLAQAAKADVDRGLWLRVSAQTQANPVRLQRLEKQASHMLSNSTAANGLVWIAAGQAVEAGQACQWLAL